MKLNLGCGNDIRQGYINCDKYPIDESVMFVDMDKLPLSFNDNTISEIVLNHSLEHIHNRYGLIFDCHRILKPGGILNISLPNTLLPKVDHTSFGHTPNYFYNTFINKHFSIYVAPGLRVKSLKFFMYNIYRNFRNWLYRQLFTEYRYVLKKR